MPPTKFKIKVHFESHVQLDFCKLPLNNNYIKPSQKPREYRRLGFHTSTIYLVLCLAEQRMQKYCVIITSWPGCVSNNSMRLSKQQNTKRLFLICGTI